MATLIAPERRRTVRAPMSYEEYLILPDDGRRVEWVNGEGIHHQSPIVAHQEIVIFLAILLSGYVRRLNLGLVLGGLFEVRLWPNGPAREPDVLFIGRERLAQLTERRFEGGPDLVVEVVSPGSVTIDRVDKFLGYEQANVSEYWIIDPRPHQQQADFYIRDAGGRFAWLWQEELPDAERITAGLLADAPDLPDELRALYREMARVLGEP